MCHGYAQCRIAKILDIDKAYVSRITKQLVNEGYICALNSKTTPRCYKPTDRPYPVDQKKRGGRYTSPTEVCRVHCIAMSYLLVRPPKIPIKWDKEWTNNNITFCQLRQVFDVGLVTIRLIKSKDSPHRLVIWMPERYLSYEQLETHTTILESYCQHVANWFMKTYHCQLGLPEIYQKPHFGFVEDPDFIHTVKRLNLSSEHCWADDSDRHSEWETDDVKLAKIKLELPEKVLSLEIEVNGIKDTVNRIATSVDQLLNIFDAPKPPDEKRDVA